MIDSIRVAIGQMRPRKGDYDGNLARIGSVFAQVSQFAEPPDLVVFPETAVSGYFVQGGVAEVAVSAGTLFRDLAQQHELSGAPGMDAVVGFYERFENRLFNSAVYASLGGVTPGIRHVHRKVFLPTYGLFDEKRFVEEGNEIRAFDAPWGRAAIAVCEDIWHSIIPTLAALDGAQVIIIPSAAPARGVSNSDPDVSGPSTVGRWEERLRQIAMEHGVYVILGQLVGFEGGKALQGSSTIVGPDGTVLARGPLFEDAVVTATLSSGSIARALAARPLLGDLEGKLANLLESRAGKVTVRFDEADQRDATHRPGPPAEGNVVHGVDRPDPLHLDVSLAEKWLVSFLRDEVTARRAYDLVLVGLSGGVDSATTTALAVRAFGPDNVIGIRMPYRTSSEESLAHAGVVADQLGIKTEIVDITDAVDGYARAVGNDLDATRRGNVMARVRMITLFDLSAKLHALPLGTGNKTERLLGYFTWHADDSPPVNPLGDLFKTQIRLLARHLGVPDIVIDKPATADLVPGQTDEGDLGVSYDEADKILHWMLLGYADEVIASCGLSPDKIALVRERFAGTHWKRHLPTVAVVSDTAIGESFLRPVDY